MGISKCSSAQQSSENSDISALFKQSRTSRLYSRKSFEPSTNLQCFSRYRNCFVCPVLNWAVSIPDESGQEQFQRVQRTLSAPFCRFASASQARESYSVERGGALACAGTGQCSAEQTQSFTADALTSSIYRSADTDAATRTWIQGRGAWTSRRRAAALSWKRARECVTRLPDDQGQLFRADQEIYAITSVPQEFERFAPPFNTFLL